MNQEVQEALNKYNSTDQHDQPLQILNLLKQKENH